MNLYMYEPRSKIDDYDENNDEHQSSWGLAYILLFPLMVIGMFCFELFFVLGLFFYYLSDLHKTTKVTIKTGEISYPFLAQVGIFIMVVLLSVFLCPPSDMDNNHIPFKLIGSVFVFNHTILPYTAVLIYKLRCFFGAASLNNLSSG